MKKHILVADDDTLLADMISRCLTANGYTVTTANSGEEAFSFLEVHSFDLVLCDIHMDGLDGFAVLAACKTMHSQTKVILCSGDVAYEAVSKAFQCGADSFLAKPFLASELKHQVNRYIGREQPAIPEKRTLPTPPAQFVSPGRFSQLIHRQCTSGGVQHETKYPGG